MTRHKLSDIKQVSVVTYYEVERVLTLKEWRAQTYDVAKSQYVYDPKDYVLCRGEHLWNWAQANTKYGSRKVVILKMPDEKVVEEYKNGNNHSIELTKATKRVSPT